MQRSAVMVRISAHHVVASADRNFDLGNGLCVLAEYLALRSELFTLYDWDGSSAAVVPSIRYDPYPFLELTIGAQLFAGRWPNRPSSG